MQIESYLIEEAEALIADPEELDEYKRLVKELGLEGQQALMGEGETPCPFQPMSITTKRTLETIFPEKCDVKEFRGETIPIRVLSLIYLAQQENYFDHIKVWYARNYDDPVVVGIKGEEWGGDHFLISRWGKALKPMERLTEMAIEKKANEYRNEARGRLARMQAIIDDPKSMARVYMDGGHVYI